MIDFRLLKTVPKTKKYIVLTVFFQWLSLLCNAVLLASIAWFIDNLRNANILKLLMIQIICITGKLLSSYLMKHMAYGASTTAKYTLRSLLFERIIDLGPRISEISPASEVTQVVSEGVDQLEIYYGSYIPQFFYAFLAPLTLFVILSFYNFKVALVLLIAVPLIPVSIVLVQKFAKKILNKYWGAYSGLGVSFLDSLQGLTTLKVFQADERMTERMDEDSENFRKATMRVLIMQLNSISVMDLVAYGGAALAILLSYFQYSKGAITLGTLVFFVLIASEFFIPMRLLGSFFHIAMNGVAAAEKMYKILDVESSQEEPIKTVSNLILDINELSYAYTEKNVLNSINLTINRGDYVAFVGESGSGKSTLLSLLSGTLNSKESITLDGYPLIQYSDHQRAQLIHRVSHDNYIFKGTIRSNLEMSGISDESLLWKVLDIVSLTDFANSNQGLDTELKERGSNLSGGQGQRLILARALLKEAPIYLLDEITSNVDAQSEIEIMRAVKDMVNLHKTVVIVSHRLANVVNCDRIYVLKDGSIVEEGTHNQLMDNKGHYYNLYTTQESLESLSFLEEGGAL